MSLCYSNYPFLSHPAVKLVGMTPTLHSESSCRHRAAVDSPSESAWKIRRRQVCAWHERRQSFRCKRPVQFGSHLHPVGKLVAVDWVDVSLPEPGLNSLIPTDPTRPSRLQKSSFGSGRSSLGSEPGERRARPGSKWRESTENHDTPKKHQK